MINKKSTLRIALRIWLYTCICFCLGWLVYGGISANNLMWAFPIAGIAACVGSLPVFVLLLFIIPYIATQQKTTSNKIYMLYCSCFLLTIPYGIIAGLICWVQSHCILSNTLLVSFITILCLFSCSAISLIIIHNKLNQHFSTIQINNFMEQNQFQQTDASSNTHWQPKPANNTGNKTLIKGVITGALILLLLIPTVFVSDLVIEREKRQQEVVKDITAGWALPQTISGPFICVPYTTGEKDAVVTKQLFIMPENLNVDGSITPELRQRSIYLSLIHI